MSVCGGDVKTLRYRIAGNFRRDFRREKFLEISEKTMISEYSLFLHLEIRDGAWFLKIYFRSVC